MLDESADANSVFNLNAVDFDSDVDEADEVPNNNNDEDSNGPDEAVDGSASKYHI